MVAVTASPLPQQAYPAKYFPSAPGCQMKLALLLVQIIKTCSPGCLLVQSRRPFLVDIGVEAGRIAVGQSSLQLIVGPAGRQERELSARF